MILRKNFVSGHIKICLNYVNRERNLTVAFFKLQGDTRMHLIKPNNIYIHTNTLVKAFQLRS